MTELPALSSTVEAVSSLCRDLASESPDDQRSALDQQALDLARQQLAVANDHLAGLELLASSGSMSTWAPYTLLRAVVESTARAWWLLDVEHDGEHREQRALSYRYDDALAEISTWQRLCELARRENAPEEAIVESEDKLKGYQDTRAAVLDEAIDQGHTICAYFESDEGETFSEKRTGQAARGGPEETRKEIYWVGEAQLNRTDLVGHAINQEETAYGQWLYDLLSSAAHGRPFVTNPDVESTQPAPDPDGWAEAHVAVDTDRLDSQYKQARGFLARIAGQLAAASGHCFHRILLTAVEGTIEEGAWPPPQAMLEDAIPTGQPCPCCGTERQAIRRGDGTFAFCATCPVQTTADQHIYRKLTGRRADSWPALLSPEDAKRIPDTFLAAEEPYGDADPPTYPTISLFEHPQDPTDS